MGMPVLVEYVRSSFPVMVEPPGTLPHYLASAQARKPS